jgi:hypothetical protein
MQVRREIVANIRYENKQYLNHIVGKNNKKVGSMRLFVFTVVVCAAHAQDVREIMHKYSENEASQNEQTREEHVTTRLNGFGPVKSVRTEYEIQIIDGKRVRRLTERNGRPVTEQEANRRQQRKERVARRFPSARLEDQYDKFQFEGEEKLNGRMAWVVTATKKNVTFPLAVNYSSQTRNVRVWIDQSEFACAKLEGDEVGNMFNLAGKAKTVTASLAEYMRMAEGVWLPARTVKRMALDAPLGLFPLSMASRFKNQVEVESTYTDYKKFHADSRILEIPANPDQP